MEDYIDGNTVHVGRLNRDINAFVQREAELNARLDTFAGFVLYCSEKKELQAQCLILEALLESLLENDPGFELRVVPIPDNELTSDFSVPFLTFEVTDIKHFEVVDH